jgi:hypothetical protein
MNLTRAECIQWATAAAVAVHDRFSMSTEPLRSVWWLDLATAMHEGSPQACLDYAQQAREYIQNNRGRWHRGWRAQLMRRAKVAIALAEQAAKTIRDR